MRTLLLFCAFCAAALAQSGATISGDAKNTWNMVKNNVLKAAEKMPEENYSFKPSPDVRSFGQLLGHIADSQYMICGAAHPNKPPQAGVEKSKTAKADIVQALKESGAYCDAAYDLASDTNSGDVMKFFGRDRTRSGVLNFNTMHVMEHYGNIVTYMRIKGLVPPSSEGR